MRQLFSWLKSWQVDETNNAAFVRNMNVTVVLWKCTGTNTCVLYPLSLVTTWRWGTSFDDPWMSTLPGPFGFSITSKKPPQERYFECLLPRWRNLILIFISRTEVVQTVKSVKEWTYSTALTWQGMIWTELGSSIWQKTHFSSTAEKWIEFKLT